MPCVKRPHCANHCSVSKVDALRGSPVPFFLLLFPTVVRNLFQREGNIVFSQVHVLHVSLVPFFLFPNSQLIPKGRKFCIFTGTCAACVFRPIFFYSLLRNLFQSARKTVVSQVHVLHVYFVQFFSTLIRNLFQNARNIVFSQVNAACVFRPIFSIP